MNTFKSKYKFARLGRALVVLMLLGAFFLGWTRSVSADIAGCASATGGISGVGRGKNVNGVIGGTAYNNVLAAVIFFDVTGTANDVQAFCIQLSNHTAVGDCYNTGSALTGDLAKALHNFPPDNTKSNEENAARQAVIWHFSDGFNLTGPSDVKTLYDAMLASFPALPSPPSNDPPVMTVSPTNANKAVNGTQEFTLTVTKGGVPVVGQVIPLTNSGVGTLSTNSVTTNNDGQATFSVTSAVAGSSSISAKFSYQLPQGTQFEPVVPGKQKLVLGQATTGNVTADPGVQWYTPTAAALIGFDAQLSKKQVKLTWETGSELNVIGFNVWRSTKRNGKFNRVNPNLVPAQNIGSVTGGTYLFRDKTVKAGKTFFYKVEIVRAAGAPEWSAVKKVSMP